MKIHAIVRRPLPALEPWQCWGQARPRRWKVPCNTDGLSPHVPLDMFLRIQSSSASDLLCQRCLKLI